jgi:xanthine dehydrogenase YagS FAD-binding subunit
VILAGGTNLIDMMRLEIMNPAAVVDIQSLPLNQIETLPSGGFRIGSLVRNSDLAFHPSIQKEYPVLSQAILSGASPQIRNQATVGGNLMQRTRCTYFRDGISPCSKRNPGTGCSAEHGYHRSHAVLGISDSCSATHPSDMCVALAALDAQIVLEGKKEKRTVPITEFYLLPQNTPWKETALEPAEIITAVDLPELPEGTRTCYLKVRDRSSYEFALVSAAVVLEFNQNQIQKARIALGGIAVKPWRVPEAEKLLHHSTPSKKLFQTCAETALKGAKPKKDNEFKVELAKRVILHALSLASKTKKE